MTIDISMAVFAPSDCETLLGLRLFLARARETHGVDCIVLKSGELAQDTRRSLAGPELRDLDVIDYPPRGYPFLADRRTLENAGFALKDTESGYVHLMLDGTEAHAMRAMSLFARPGGVSPTIEDYRAVHSLLGDDVPVDADPVVCAALGFEPDWFSQHASIVRDNTNLVPFSNNPYESVRLLPVSSDLFLATCSQSSQIAPATSVAMAGSLEVESFTVIDDVDVMGAVAVATHSHFGELRARLSHGRPTAPDRFSGGPGAVSLIIAANSTVMVSKRDAVRSDYVLQDNGLDMTVDGTVREASQYMNPWTGVPFWYLRVELRYKEQYLPESIALLAPAVTMYGEWFIPRGGDRVVATGTGFLENYRNRI